MKELKKQYESSRRESIEFMKNGQIAAYLNALIAMNNYKRMMLAVVAN